MIEDLISCAQDGRILVNERLTLALIGGNM